MRLAPSSAALSRAPGTNPWAIRVPAAFVVLLGLTVLTGWVTRTTLLIQIVPGTLGMVFNTALQFLLLGSALLLPVTWRHQRLVLRSIAVFVIALSSLVLAQYLFGFDAGVDRLVAEPWLPDANPSPGRMAPNTCVCFISAGCLLLLFDRAPSRRLALVIPILNFVILILAGIGLAGFLLRLDFLYGWFNYTRMAVHTAVGNLALGIAFWTSWQRQTSFLRLYAGREDRKVALIAGGILVGIVLTAGLAGFGIMLHATAETLTAGLESALDHRLEVLRHDLSGERESARVFVRDETVIAALASGDPEPRAELVAMLRGAVRDHYRYAAVLDQNGKVVAKAGTQAPREMSVRAPGQPIGLTWAGEMLISIEAAITRRGERIGSFVALAHAPQLEEALKNPDAVGSTSVLNLCVDAGERLKCFPSRHSPGVTERPKRVWNRDAPMTLATRGERGVSASMIDTRGKNVLAAYRLLPELGLGMVLKLDAQELYRPVRRRALVVWPVLLLLVILGTWLIRTQVEPLVRTILIAERNASAVSEALAESERRTRAVLDTVSDGILSLDTAGYIESINPAARRLLGIAPRRAQGRQLFDLLGTGAQNPALERALRLASAGKSGDSAQTVEIEYAGPQGKVDLEVVLSGAIGPATTRLVAAVRDISERRRVERMKDEFVATVSHELRTPLTSIRGSLGLVASGVLGALPENARRLLDIAQTNSERLMRLINDLLDIDKMAAGKLEFKREPLALRPLVERAIETTRGIGAARQVSIELGAGGASPRVLGDADRLEQAIVNLLSNAVKFSPDGGAVRVSITLAGAHVRVSVRDQGPGVPDDFRDRIFTKFSQADASDARAKGGTGLGLSITRAIILGHEGSIDYESRPGAGAHFFFELPVLPAEAAPSAPPFEFTALPNLFRQARILHVESDRQTREVIGALLEPIAEVVGVDNLERARAAVAKTQFDVVLLELELGGEDGAALIDDLSRDALHVPIIVFTEDDGRIDTALLSRVESVLIKTRVTDEMFKREVERVIVNGGGAEAKRHAG